MSNNYDSGGIYQTFIQVVKRITKLFITILYPPFKHFFYLFVRKRDGVKVVIFYKDKLLLIRNSYRKGWTFPGGSIKRNESFERAAVREIYEEVGIHISNIKNHGFVAPDINGGSKTAVFSCKVNTTELIIDNLEVEGAVWIDIDEASRLQLLPVATKCARLLNL